MPTVFRHINRIFRRNARDSDSENNNINSNPHNEDPQMNAEQTQTEQRRHIRIHRQLNHGTNEMTENVITLKTTGFERQTDGSVKLSVTLDKDKVECCVCLSSMTDKIYRCRGNGNNNNKNSVKKERVCHNICGDCEWSMKRMKSNNGHTKPMQCPICKVRGSFVRNNALEKQLRDLTTECENNKYGCPQRFFPWDKETQTMHTKHDICAYNSVDCPFCYQTIHGGRVNFVEHLVKSVNNSEEKLNSLQSNNDNGNESEELPAQQSSSSPLQSETEEMEFEEDESEIKECQSSSESDKNEEAHSHGKCQFVPPCLLAFYESEAIVDLSRNERDIIDRSRNEFVVNFNLGIIVCFVAPTADCECWKVYALSISPRHSMGGNSKVYVQYTNYETITAFNEKEHSLGIVTNTTCLNRPITNTLILTLGKLHPHSLRKLFRSYPSTNPFLNHSRSKTKNFKHEKNSTEMKMEIDNLESNPTIANLSESELFDLSEHKPAKFLAKSPCTPLQCGFIYGKESAGAEIPQLCVRTFTLEESFKVGAIIDARDFMGKWYEAEIIAVQDWNGHIFHNLDNDSNDFLDIRRAKIHYLGYSVNYDEWLLIDTDSHRIAHRGTYTLGPDLRAIRKNTTHLHSAHQNIRNVNHRMRAERNSIVHNLSLQSSEIH